MYQTAVAKRYPGLILIWRILWGFIIPVAVLLAIWWKMDSMDHFSLWRSLSEVSFVFLALAIALLPLNLALEVITWQMLAEPFSKRSFSAHFKTILAGKSLNMISPFGLGESFSRYAKTDGNGLKPLLPIGLERLVKMVPTYVFGLISIAFLISEGLGQFTLIRTALITIGLCFVVMITCIILWQDRLPPMIKKAIWSVNMNTRRIASALGFAFFRYLIFSLQFFLVMKSIGLIVAPEILIMGIFWIFFVKTIVPIGTALGDLSKRELSAVFFFSLFSVSVEKVVLACLAIWLINIVIPATIGVFHLSDLKEKH